ANLDGQICRGLRGRHGAHVQTSTHTGAQESDELGGCPPGAEPERGAVLDEVQSPLVDRHEAAPEREVFFNCSLAAARTLSTVKPNFFCSSFSGAEAPKVRMPRMLPFRPT